MAPRFRPAASAGMALALALACGTALAAPSKIAPPPVGTVALSGELHLDAPVTGVMQLYLDDTLHASVPVAPGPFAMDLPRAGDAGSVRLEFVAEGRRLRSLLGTQESLVRRSGRRGALGVADVDGLRVSALTTALAVLVDEVLDGPPDGRGDLAWALDRMGMLSVGERATVADMVTIDPGLLPDGYADAVELVSDPAAVMAFALADPSVRGPGRIDALPVVPLAAGTALPRALPLMRVPRVPQYAVWGHETVLERGIAKWVFHEALVGPVPWSGGFGPDGVLRLEPDQPLYRLDYALFCDGKASQVLDRVVARDLRRHWRGEDRTLWYLAETVSRTSPECPDALPVLVRSGEYHRAPDMVRAAAQTLPRRMLGAQELPWLCEVDLPPGGRTIGACGRARHVLHADGTGTVVPPGDVPRAITWVHDDSGAIRIDQGDFRLRFWRIDPMDQVMQPIAWVGEGTIDYEDSSAGVAYRTPGPLPAVSRAGSTRR
jgi:hypothetical protein